MPMHPILARLQSLGDDADAPFGKPGGAVHDTPFCVQGRLPAGALVVQLAGIGRLASPMPAQQAAALQQASTPAHYGLREHTLLNTAVRDTGEITADAIHLHWADGALAALQHSIAQGLGLPAVQMRLHKLLVYGPGQFFKPHQDTEKHPGMVASLVLVWPSAHIGGDLVVVHGQRTQRLVSQQLAGDDIRWCAFFSDCRHEVLPVQEGWRVVLSLDLVLPADAAATPRAPDAALVHAMRQQFNLAPDATTAPATQPWVLLLDHSYTEHGLRWPLLKGADRARAQALQQAALALGLTVHLALAELHETWTAQPGGAGRRGAPAQPVPDEFIEGSLCLDFWVDADGPVQPPPVLAIAHDAAASFTETGDDHLVDEQYEGYMGNYGETLDYWYRRAALVIQTPLGMARARFASNFDAALAEACTLAQQPGAGAALAQRLAAAADSLAAQARHQGRQLLAAYATLAAALPDDAQALALAQAFEARHFLPEDAAALAGLAKRRGSPFMLALVQAWASAPTRHSWSGPVPAAPWPQDLPAFTQAALASGLDAAVLGHWQRAHLASLQRLADTARGMLPTAQADLRQRLLDLVCALATAMRALPGAGPELQALVQHVLAQPLVYPADSLAPLVHAVGPVADAVLPAGHTLRQSVQQPLRAALAKAERAADDHSLPGLAWTCRCRDCAQLAAWAAAPGSEPLQLAMPEPRRKHVEQTVRAVSRALRTSTLKQGSPYKLVVAKPPSPHADERAARAAMARALAALSPGDAGL